MMHEDPTTTGKPEEVPNNGDADQKEKEANTDDVAQGDAK